MQKVKWLQTKIKTHMNSTAKTPLPLNDDQFSIKQKIKLRKLTLYHLCSLLDQSYRPLYYSWIYSI